LHAFNIHPLILLEQAAGCIAATELVWTAIILNGTEASELLTTSGLEMYNLYN